MQCSYINKITKFNRICCISIFYVKIAPDLACNFHQLGHLQIMGQGSFFSLGKCLTLFSQGLASILSISPAEFHLKFLQFLTGKDSLSPLIFRNRTSELSTTEVQCYFIDGIQPEFFKTLLLIGKFGICVSLCFCHKPCVCCTSSPSEIMHNLHQT